MLLPHRCSFHQSSFELRASDSFRSTQRWLFSRRPGQTSRFWGLWGIGGSRQLAFHHSARFTPHATAHMQVIRLRQKRQPFQDDFQDGVSMHPPRPLNRFGNDLQTRPQQRDLPPARDRYNRPTHAGGHYGFLASLDQAIPYSRIISDLRSKKTHTNTLGRSLPQSHTITILGSNFFSQGHRRRREKHERATLIIQCPWLRCQRRL